MTFTLTSITIQQGVSYGTVEGKLVRFADQQRSMRLIDGTYQVEPLSVEVKEEREPSEGVWRKEDFKDYRDLRPRIAEAIRDGITYSHQTGSIVIHGAIEAIIKIVEGNHPAHSEESQEELWNKVGSLSVGDETMKTPFNWYPKMIAILKREFTIQRRKQKGR